ncbi:metallophosphoesterase [Variovorax sp. OV084]|uniref:metallophosphoesterase n=1 Tax=Variovorax sp. OV084 TaxID=1882777 RepID=UPI0008C5DAC5|nr:metallophosphoesterase [Variovorax sp. OV084]SEU23893.1 Calcineurin-like phosphoesterase [Variovorax sp. OV084]
MSKLLIIHLSDLHISNEQNPILKRAEAIANSLIVEPDAHVLILFTGDIAFGGKEHEYRLASDFLSRLKIAISKTHHPSTLNLICVPGNHDCDFSQGNADVRTALLENLKNSSPVAQGVIDECSNVLKPFEAFRAEVETLAPLGTDAIWRKYHVKCDDTEIIINSVNTAWSAKMSTGVGSLFFPNEKYQKASPRNGAFRITGTHLPYHWLHQAAYRDFRRLLRQNSDLILTGHEHEGNFGTNVDSESGHTVFIEGAALYPHGGSQESGFICAELDFVTGSVHTTAFNWKQGAYQPAQGEGATMTVSLPGGHETIGLNREWDESLRDLGASIKHYAKEKIELPDLWVYPEIIFDNAGDNEQLIENTKRLLESKIDERQDTLILGDQSSGKTALLRTLFLAFYEKGLYPIFIQGKSFSNASARDIIKLVQDSIRQQYDENQAEVVISEAADRKIILLDNIDRYGFPAKYFNGAIQTLQKMQAGLLQPPIQFLTLKRL